MATTRYGPNSVAAERLLDDLDHLPQPAIASLAAAGGGELGTAPDDPDVAARTEVRSRLRAIAQAGNRIAAIRAIGDEVAEWASSTSHWFPAGVLGALDSTSDMDPRMAAVPMVLDAAYAVVLEDLLADWELDLLLAPWEQVVGSPFGERADDADADDPDDPDDPDEAWPDDEADPDPQRLPRR